MAAGLTHSIAGHPSDGIERLLADGFVVALDIITEHEAVLPQALRHRSPRALEAAPARKVVASGTEVRGNSARQDLGCGSRHQGILGG